MIKKLSLAVCLLALNSNANMDYFNVDMSSKKVQKMFDALSSQIEVNPNNTLTDPNFKPKKEIADKYNKVYTKAMKGDIESFEYLMQRIYMGSIENVQLFNDDILRPKRIDHIKDICVDVFNKHVSKDMDIVCINSIMEYCKNYAKEKNFFNYGSLIRSLYLQMQYEKSSQYDNY